MRITNARKFQILHGSYGSFSLAGLVLTAFFFAFFAVFPGKAFCDSDVAVLVSRSIVPYVEAVDALSAKLADLDSIDLEVFSFDGFSGKKQDLLVEKLVQDKFGLFIAIGPEAARFLQTRLPERNGPILYSMVLNPDKILEPAGDVCGVSLGIPVATQLEKISEAVPSLKKIGLVYDPGHNEDFFAQAKREALAFGVEIVPLRVEERRNIPQILKSGFALVDGLWMIPDRTVISESIVQYIIKEALLRNKPVIGYNKFFYESGAVLAFVFEYRELGRQAADMAVKILNGTPCPTRPPRFRTWVNERVAEKLGIDVVVVRAGGVEAGP
jgi:putative ABC transport system substrate-binding protein